MYLSAMRYPVFFYPLHLYVFVLICQYYVVLLERTNKDIIYSPQIAHLFNIKI